MVKSTSWLRDGLLRNHCVDVTTSGRDRLPPAAVVREESLHIYPAARLGAESLALT